MKVNRRTFVLLGLVALGVAVSALAAAREDKKVDKRVFELRIYHVNSGKMPALNDRFRNHTNKLLEKHGMTLIGFWTPTDAKDAEATLYYLVAHPSQEAATKNWTEFRADPEWKAAKEASEKDGVLVAKVDQIFLNPTNYSAMK